LRGSGGAGAHREWPFVNVLWHHDTPVAVDRTRHFALIDRDYGNETHRQAIAQRIARMGDRGSRKTG
jgi:hypothetical protein